jgi:formate dehydrogenase major subunit/formate dehydrogenase alpha subunit
LPNVFPGYQPVTRVDVREKFAGAWGIETSDLSDTVGLTVTEMMPAAAEGKLKALYILGEDPIMSDPDTSHIRHCLETCDFVLLQEIFPSETAPYADVMLPGASFAEKDGTFTNTERRIQLVRKAIESPGEARPDWWIISELAKRVLTTGVRQSTPAPYSGWEYENTAQIMEEIAALTPSYAGVSIDRLHQGESFQWPVKDQTHGGTPILHVGQFARGLGKFHPIEHIPPAEMPDNDFPMILSTGRVLYHWHGGQMSRRSKGLLEIYPQALIEVNEEDAAKLGLNGNKRVRVSSRRGSIEAEALVTDRVPPGMVFANFHFPEASANELTIAALDPVAKIPEYKVCAVRVEAVS